MMKRNMKGFGLLELLLSLTVIIALLITATRFYEVTVANRKINTAIDMVHSLYTASTTYFDQFGPATEITGIQVLADKNLVPQNFMESNVNPWGGAITIVGTAANMATVTLTEVPVDSCNNIAAKMQASLGALVDPSCATEKNELTVTFTDLAKG